MEKPTLPEAAKGEGGTSALGVGAAKEEDEPKAKGDCVAVDEAAGREGCPAPAPKVKGEEELLAAAPAPKVKGDEAG